MSTTVVIPCFNEADRIDLTAIDALVRALHAVEDGCRVLLVDDGSTDGTADLLASLADGHEVVEFLRLDRNRGKAEAVRHGLRTAVASGATVVGYCDADFATPPEEVARLLAVLRGHPEDLAVIGSRVLLLGHAIHRSPTRHYVGRVFATLSGAILGVGVYDTQCGAKWFRAGDPLRRALDVPFRSRWGFDVELLGRLLRSGARADELREVPLDAWRDVGGSKVTARAGIRTLVDLARIRRDLRRWS